MSNYDSSVTVSNCTFSGNTADNNAEFACAMENVLELYQRPYDPKRPVVCMDETSKQLVKETRVPITASP